MFRKRHPLEAWSSKARARRYWWGAGGHVGPAQGFVAGIISILLGITLVGFWLRHGPNALGLGIAGLVFVLLGGVCLALVRWKHVPR